MSVLAAAAPAMGPLLAAGALWPHVVGASLAATAIAYHISRRAARKAAVSTLKTLAAPPKPVPPRGALEAGGKGMLMVAHRGMSFQAPENTLDAIRLAFEHGAVGVEFDVQRSKDGELFLLHDDTLRRTASKYRSANLDSISQEAYETMLDQDVSELSYWDFLRHVDVEFKGQSTRPCLLSEVVDEIPDGRFALCEIKGGDEACARDIAAFVKAKAVPEEKLAFIGFDFELMVLLKRLLVEAGKSQMQVISLKDAYSEAVALEHIAIASGAGLDGVDFEADASVVTKSVVEAAQDAEVHIGVWIWADRLPMSDGVANVAAFHDLGVTFFTSDLPPDVCEWMASPSTTASPCSSCGPCE